MPRVYWPIWCAKDNCKNCNFLDCDSKVIKLFSPYKYNNIDFADRPKEIDTTSMAIYFGYCQRLAKFFLMFPQIAPISVVEHNFFSDVTGLPAEVPIQRIFLDMLNHGDAEAPTDEVHRLRLMLGMKITHSEQALLGINGREKKIAATEKEIEEFWTVATSWADKVLSGKAIAFSKTEELMHCRYCFLPNCEVI